MADMTEFEKQFFATGELPPELLAEVAPVAAPTPTPTPKTESVQTVAPTPFPNEDATEAIRRSLTNEQALRVAAETRLQELEKQMAALKTPEVAAPDPNLDPLGSMLHQLQQVNTNVAELQTKLTQEQQNNILRQQFTEFTNSVRQIKEAFEQTTPDFKDAYAHIRNIRTEDLRSVGVPDDKITQILLQDELNIAQTAIQRGKNPAEEIYNMSKRYGYQPKSAKQTTTPQQKLENIAKGVDAAKQLDRAAPDTELSLESLKDASDSDLAKIVRDDKLWAKIAGGKSDDLFR